MPPQQMPVLAFTVAYSGIANVIQSPVKVSAAFDPRILPHPEMRDFSGIWDTGATGSVITTKVIEQCALQPISMARVNTAGGIRDTEVYLVNFFLPNGCGIPGIRVTHGILHDGADILIGMDVIGTGDFAITNHQGKTHCSFRLPSVECIDFVKNPFEPHQSMGNSPHPIISRRGPCPCGSGRQYRNCCEKKK